MLRKRKPGRPAGGTNGVRDRVVPVKFSAREIKAIEEAIEPPATVSSWIRDHALVPLGIADVK